jgi:hypothetical protein
MFEKGLRSRIRLHVVSLGYPTLRGVADAALALEREIARGKEAATKANQATEKGKGKRPFAAVQGAVAPVQGAPLAGGPAPQKDTRACYSCGQVGHLKRNCPQPRQGGQGRGGGRGPAQGRGQGQYQQRAPQPVQQQQYRIEAPPAGQVNAVYEAPSVQIEPVISEEDTPLPPMVEPRVYRIPGAAERGIFFHIHPQSC